MYDVAPSDDSDVPGLPGHVVFREDHDEVVDSLAADLFVQAQACVRAFGDFQLAVSASAACEPLLMRLMIDPQVRSLPWGRTRIWLCDEQDGSRGRLLHDYWGFHSGVPETQFHLIESSDEVGANAYDTLLRDTLAWREPGHDRLDAVILSIDADARVAGLCPEDAIDDQRLIRSRTSATGSHSASMTLRLINASRLIAVLASGDEARRGLERVRDELALNERRSPASRLSPVGGALKWYLDRASRPRPVLG